MYNIATIQYQWIIIVISLPATADPGVWKKGQSWAGAKVHMSGNKRPMMQSVPPSPTLWR